MIPIPKELKGDVQKFEDYFSSQLAILDRATFDDLVKGYHKLSQMMFAVTEALDFYTQPFKPEMIEKYFEGWEIERYVGGNDFCFINEKGRVSFFHNNYIRDGYRIDFLIEAVETKRHLYLKTFFAKSYPKTLSDFVDVCLNSDIKLKWR